MTERPNILVIMADQLNPAFLPAYGHPVARTPHLDRLAEQGVVFERAYCNSPLCAPSRASFMTGLLPSQTGVYDNAAPLGSDIPTFAHLLREQGYHTVLSGKMHFTGPDQLHGFDERLTTDIYPADFEWTPDWRVPDERLSWHHNMSSVTEAGTCIRSNQLDFDDEVVFQSVRKLFGIARGDDNPPFCMVAALSHPHDPYAIPERFYDLFTDGEIAAPALGVDDVEADPHSARLRQIYAMDEPGVTEADVIRARRAYLGAIAYVDAQTGLLLDALEQAGLADDTVVIFTADHGEMLGERGLWYKMSFFEGSARVPLIVRGPGFAPGRVERSVSLIDLLPSFADLAGAQPVLPVEGRSLLPHLRGEDGPDGVVAEYLAEGTHHPMIMIRRDHWKFVHAPPDPDQLFDLEADPLEMRNLAADPAQQAVCDGFRDEIARRWDLPSLHETVLRSQARRRHVASAMRRGRPVAWDHQPAPDAHRIYVRNHMTLDAIEARARFPRLDSPTETPRRDMT